jgi:hypothetical protein
MSLIVSLSAVLFAALIGVPFGALTRLISGIGLSVPRSFLVHHRNSANRQAAARS